MGDVIQGPWPSKPTPAEAAAAHPFKWRSQFPSAVEDRRDAILNGRPHCSICDVIYPLNVRVPPDGICRQCRRDIENGARDADDPGLF
ncbi:hypothetical protein GMA5_25 [Gordonia phage GMA5]|uniref:Uncharacterized protein n=1 Tax=Gordonia phage GMA5 TaxID=1647472 RepID=A0A0K0MWT4_9CAUD|nr:hypothetical protein BH786_gp25 [Gordonia phage GMA5]AKI28639.1 hypothetical protein GMA5_25 [Gordonia phage GMA5]